MSTETQATYYRLIHDNGRWGVYKTHKAQRTDEEPFAWFDTKAQAEACQKYYRNLPEGTAVGRMKL